MPGLRHLLQEKREDILRIASRYGAGNVRVFGSVQRGEDTEGSDVDLLVDFEQGRSLLDQVGLIQDLEDLLGCRVDVITEAGLHWYIRDRVRKEAKAL
ncbi:MAG: Nucleotidyltransferase domain protein [Methanoregulaceae archaeon PtaU1.Bin059]|nr:MAG: Nucleotidyltransferase domain protein [Methanoregulaceae archaeon PtaU1.Bin059]